MQHSPFYEIFGNFAKNTSVHYERHLRKTPVDDNITLGLPNIDIWRDIMAEMRLGAVESHFADIVWEHAPLTTRELTVLCEKELNWKRTTTYTVLKKMCNRGIFRTENSVVSVLISKEEFSSIQSEQFVEENFRGSLPAFIAAFTARHAPTAKELSEIKEMIALYEEENQ